MLPLKLTHRRSRLRAIDAVFNQGRRHYLQEIQRPLHAYDRLQIEQRRFQYAALCRSRQKRVQIVDGPIEPIQIDASLDTRHSSPRRVLPKRPSRPLAHFLGVLTFPFCDPEIGFRFDVSCR